MQKSNRKLKTKIAILIATITICSLSFATNNELNEYYSKYVLSENINEGIKVSLIKSDRYDNFQDEYVAVDIKVENANRYANVEVKVEAVDHDDFTTLGDKTISFNLLSGDISEMIFDFRNDRTQKPYTPIGSQSEYIKSTQSSYIRATFSSLYESEKVSPYVKTTESEAIKYNVKKRETRFGKDINLHWDDERATSPDASERYIRDRKKIEEEEVTLKEKGETNKRKFVYILAVVFIVVLIALIVIYFIRRYIKSNEGFYNIFLIIGLSLVLSICSITLKVQNIYAYTQQTFMMNTTYSHEYLCEVWNGGIPWTFKFRVSYKFTGEVPSFNESLDSDGDGLLDNYEVYFITDRFSIDTDGDGISDYDEIYTIDTDPLKVDTNNNGKTDSEEDYDGDGLTNIEEKNLNTFMDNSDTDSDGLTDYEEVRVYHTDALKVDTDNDGLSDYEEVQVAKKLGISDISAIDTSFKLNQKLSRDNMAKDLYMNNIIEVSVEGNVPGLIDKHIELKSTNNESLKNAESVLGKPIYIETDYSDKVTIKFDCSNYKERIDGLRVATLVNGKIKLLDTSLVDNTISAEVGGGYVFVLDGIRYIDEIFTYKKDNFR